jgi:hypothetical protein
MPELMAFRIREQDWLREAGQGNGATTAPLRLHAVNGDQSDVPAAGPWEAAVAKLVEFQHIAGNCDGQGARALPKTCGAALAGIVPRKAN